MRPALIVAAALLALYALAAAALALAGRRSDARALPGFVPDCAVLFRRLLGDPEVPRGLVRGAGPAVIERHWPGAESSLRVVLRLAGARVS